MSDVTSTILLIDNDQYTRELYQRELGRDFQVLACSNESEALDLLFHHSVDVIILEPYLDSHEGWAFLAMLHTLPHTSDIPIIICSTLDERPLGFELGARYYLIKPVLPFELLDTTHRIIPSGS
ncbi:MAG TPA: response regulator [Chloroflexia bacterium]|nr:response regulator [Chloroflexia bacterium]